MNSCVFKLITGFMIICLIQYLCNLFVKIMHIAFPAPILGLIVFAILLHFNIIKKSWIEDICNLLLKYMPLLFVPLFVGIVAYYGVIEKNFIPIIVNLLIATTLTLLLTAIFVENVIKFVRLRKIRKLHRD